jgi:microcystin-dependent protein
MVAPYLGEVRAFAFVGIPSGWALCDGRILKVEEYRALAGVLGSAYGGDGVNTFGLPDLQGRVPRHKGASEKLGERAGAEAVRLSAENLPRHAHTLYFRSGGPTTENPSGNVLGNIKIYAKSNNLTSMFKDTFETNGDQAHENMQPSIVINYCIALVGSVPTQA